MTQLEHLLITKKKNQWQQINIIVFVWIKWAAKIFQWIKICVILSKLLTVSLIEYSDSEMQYKKYNNNQAIQLCELKFAIASKAK